MFKLIHHQSFSCIGLRERLILILPPSSAIATVSAFTLSLFSCSKNVFSLISISAAITLVYHITGVRQGLRTLPACESGSPGRWYDASTRSHLSKAFGAFLAFMWFLCFAVSLRSALETPTCWNSRRPVQLVTPCCAWIEFLLLVVYIRLSLSATLRSNPVIAHPDRSDLLSPLQKKHQCAQEMTQNVSLLNSTDVGIGIRFPPRTKCGPFCKSFNEPKWMYLTPLEPKDTKHSDFSVSSPSTMSDHSMDPLWR